MLLPFGAGNTEMPRHEHAPVFPDAEQAQALMIA